MTIYEVWDDDPMENHCAGYRVAAYMSRKAAEDFVESRNAQHRESFIREATNGASRVDREAWNWRTARVVDVEVVE